MATIEQLALYRHIGESLLYAYAQTSDTKNPAAAREILSDAVVVFGDLIAHRGATNLAVLDST